MVSHYRLWFLAQTAFLGLQLFGASAFAGSFTPITSGTWVAPTGVTAITVEAWGGGGGGGGATANSAKGGGGAGGQYVARALTVVAGNSYAVVVGAGGDSSFAGASGVIAKGGAGGAAGTVANGTAAAGAGSASSAVGTVVYAGGSGSAGDGSSASGGAGGGGAGSTGAGGAASGNTAGVAGTGAGGGAGAIGLAAAGACTNTATAAGGGGCGGYRSSATSRAGGAGAAGRVTITWQEQPVVTTNAATNVQGTTVTFNGTVTSLNAAATVTFEYGLTTAYGTEVAATPATLGPLANTNNALANVTGLTPGTTYNYRVKAASSFGTVTGANQTFTTLVPALSITASNSAGKVGDVLTFSIVFNNPLLTDIASAVVTSVLPSGMTAGGSAPTLGGVTISGQTVTWNIPLIPAGGSAQLTQVVNLTTTGVLTTTVNSAQATSASASVVVLSGALTHFKMDEPANSWKGSVGEVVDSGGTNLNGTLTLTGSGSYANNNVFAPSPTISQQNSGVTGGFCNAGTFDGNAVVKIDNTATSKFQYTKQLSASAWIYPTAYPSSDVYSVLSNDQNYEFHIDRTGGLYWWWNADNMTSATKIPLNKWTHVAITFNSNSGQGRQYIYINGVRDTMTKSWTGTLAANPCPFYIGGDVTTGSCALLTGRNFRGKIDEVKLYDYELSSAEVNADRTLGRNCSGIAYDHIRIEHDGTGSICAPKTVTIKACLDASCANLYTGNVTVNLSPSGWGGANPFTFSGGVTTKQISVATAGSITLGTLSATPTPVNTSAVCVNGTSNSCVLNFSNASCSFDAVEVAANPRTRLFTKRAGQNFDLDLVAVTSGGGVDPTINSTLTVDLVDAATCPTGTGLTSTQSVPLASGRKTATFNYPNAAGNVRVRMQQGASAAACSTDNFAIRPQSFTVTSTAANADTTGTSGTATPAIIAGAAFDLIADAGAVNYSGTPILDSTKLTAHTGAVRAGTLAGSFGAANVASGKATGASFTYGEVGYFRLNADAVYDTMFTVVDSAVGDCVVGSSSNTAVGGKFGCNIGSGLSDYFGRFKPGRFNTIAPVACGAYTYSGQPMVNGANQVTVTAKALDGTTTLQNYAGAPFARSVTLSGGTGTWTNNVLAPGDFVKGDGKATNATYTFADKTTAPTTIAVQALESSGPDAVSSATGTQGSATVRSGRVRLTSAYGSELLNLRLPVAIEYYDTTPSSGWRTGTDPCTVLAAGNFSFAYPTSAANKLSTGKPTLAMSGSNPTPVVTLGKTGAGNTGWTDITLNLDGSAPWLKFPWGGGATDVNPSARATFGTYKSPLVFRRENY